MKNKSHQHQGKSHIITIDTLLFSMEYAYFLDHNVLSTIVLMKGFMVKGVGIANTWNVIFPSRSSWKIFVYAVSDTKKFPYKLFFEANKNYFGGFCVTEHCRSDKSSNNLWNIYSVKYLFAQMNMQHFFVYAPFFDRCFTYDNNFKFSINTKYPSDEMKSKNDNQRSK